jgi:hypothetical protein
MVVNPGEEDIAGGNVGTAVVRVGDTVRPLADLGLAQSTRCSAA